MGSLNGRKFGTTLRIFGIFIPTLSILDSTPTIHFQNRPELDLWEGGMVSPLNYLRGQ